MVPCITLILVASAERVALSGKFIQPPKGRIHLMEWKTEYWVELY